MACVSPVQYVRRGHSLMCTQRPVGLGGEGADPLQSLAPSPGGAHTSCDSRKPFDWPLPVGWGSCLQGAHLSLRMGPTVPRGLAPGWVCAASLR